MIEEGLMTWVIRAHRVDLQLSQPLLMQP